MRHRARAAGWLRGFWQGSPDHRGTPDAPGRVVTIIPTQNGYCDGVVYGIDTRDEAKILDYLDVRESGGYERAHIEVVLDSGRHVTALTYVGSVQNPNYLGSAPVSEMAAHIQSSNGPSGANIDYLLALYEALESWKIEDPHIRQLVAEIRQNSAC